MALKIAAMASTKIPMRTWNVAMPTARLQQHRCATDDGIAVMVRTSLGVRVGVFLRIKFKIGKINFKNMVPVKWDRFNT